MASDLRRVPRYPVLHHSLLGSVRDAIRLSVVVRVLAISIVLCDLMETALQVGTGNRGRGRMLLNQSFGLHDDGVSAHECARVLCENGATGRRRCCALKPTFPIQCETKSGYDVL